MNAREYDPAIARFISPDPVLDRGFPTQTLNRYTYVGNNPLSFTDPSGHGKGWKKFRKIFRMVVAIVAAFFTAGAALVAMSSAMMASGLVGGLASLGAAGGYAMTVVAGAFSGAMAGAVGGGIMCGSDCAKAGARAGAVSGGIFAGADSLVSASNMGTAGQILTRSTAGGLASDANGGKFSDGFKTAFATGTAAWGYQKIVNYGATWESGGEAVAKGDLAPPIRSANNVMFATKEVDPNAWFTEGGRISRALNALPGGNALAGGHDAMMNVIEKAGGKPAFYATVLPMIAPAAAVTGAALLDGPGGFAAYGAYQCSRGDGDCAQ